MIPAAFEYLRPRSLEEAVACLLEREPGTAAILAGGMSLIPAMKLRLARPATLVDIVRLRGLAGIVCSAEHLRIGALTTHAALGGAPELARYPVFAETAGVVADPQIRHRGTLGGSLAYAHPAADWPAVFLALQGEAQLFGLQGRRSVPAEDFFTDIFETTIGAGEILTEIRFPSVRERSGAAYSRMRLQASGMALVGVAAQLMLDAEGRIDHAFIGVTGVNAVPFRARSLEMRLRGVLPDAAALRDLCATGFPEAEPLSDPHAAADYRLQMLRVHAERALGRAFERARPAVPGLCYCAPVTRDGEPVVRP